MLSGCLAGGCGREAAIGCGFRLDGDELGDVRRDFAGWSAGLGRVRKSAARLRATEPKPSGKILRKELR